MEIQGLDDIIVFKYDNTGKLATTPEVGGLTTNMGKPGLFKIDLASSRGATQAEISNMSATATKVYGSNAVAEQTIGTASPSISLGANDIPHEIYDTLIGLEKGKYGSYEQKQSKLVQGGIIAHSHNTNNNVDLYFAFPLGTFTTGGNLNMQTNSENPVVAHDAFALAAQARPSDLLLYAKFYSDDVDFNYDNMLAYITGTEVAQAPASSKENVTPEA